MDKILKHNLYVSILSILFIESLVAINLFMLWFLRPQYLEGVVDLIIFGVIGLIVWLLWERKVK